MASLVHRELFVRRDFILLVSGAPRGRPTFGVKARSHVRRNRFRLVCPANFRIARSVRLSAQQWLSCLGYRHAGCLQLSHRRPLRDVRTADPSADGRRSAAIFAAVELPSAGGISSRRPGAIRCHSIVFAKCANVHPRGFNTVGTWCPGPRPVYLDLDRFSRFAQLSRVPGATENARREIAVYNQKSAVGMTRRERKMRHSFVGGGWKMRDTDAGIRKTDASWPRCCSTRNREDVGLSIIRRRRERLR